MAWMVRFGASEVRKPTREAGKDYMRDLVQEANIWEVADGQMKSTLDFQDTSKQTIILVNGVNVGSIYEIREN